MSAAPTEAVVPDQHLWPAGSTEAPKVNGQRRTEPTDIGTDPHDHAAERAVLGALLLRPDLIPDVDAVLADDDWHLPAHRTIWDALADRAYGDQPVSVITIAAAIGTHRSLHGHGGPLYINEIANDPAVIPDQATWHARIVHTKADERRTAGLGRWLVQAALNGTDPDTIQARIDGHQAAQGKARGTESSWAPLDLTDALKGRDDADQPTLMPRTDGLHLLYPGVNVVSGEPTSGKTWLALHAVTHELEQGNHVAYLDFEDRATRVVARLLRLGAHPEHIAERFHYIRPVLAIDQVGRQALTKAIDGATLAVLDGVTEAMTLHGLDLSSNPDVATFYALLPRWVADRGPAVCLIDHVVKDPERQGRWSIGGQHKLAGLDGASYTVKTVTPFGRGKAGHSRVFIAKDRHGHVEEHALGRCAAEFHLDSTDPNMSVARLEPPEAMPTTEAGDLRPTHLMDRVCRYLEVHPGETVRQVCDSVTGKATYVRKALNQLVAEGFVEVRTGPRNASLHHVLEPFREDGDDAHWPTEEPPV